MKPTPKHPSNSASPAPVSQPASHPISYYIARVPGGYYQLMRIKDGVAEKVGEPDLLAIATTKMAQHAATTHVSAV